MRLDFDSDTTAYPLVENKDFDEIGFSPSPSFEALLKKGIAAAQSGDRDLARKLLSQSIAMDPASEEAWMWLASISEYPEELLAFLNRVLTINPTNKRADEWRSATNSLLAKTFVQRAVAAREQGSDELVGLCLDQALVHDNDCESAWVLKASLAESEVQKAEFLARVLEINPENQDALNVIAAMNHAKSQAAFEDAKAAAAAGNRDQAVEILDEFLQNAPDSVNAWILRSHLSRSLDEKLDALKKAIEIDPENEAARSGLAFLELTFGSSNQHPEETTELVESALEMAAEYVFDDKSPEPESQTSKELEAIEFANRNTAATFVNEEPPSKIEGSSQSDERPESPEALDLLSFDFEAAGNDDLDIVAETGSLPSVEDLFDPSKKMADVEGDTAEVLSPFVEDASTQNAFAAEVEEFVNTSSNTYTIDDNSAHFDAPHVEYHAENSDSDTPDIDGQPTGFECPFCGSPNQPQAFECTACRATLTLSDIESLLSNQNADGEIIQNAVTRMEAEWNLREFTEQELTDLSIGHFNLHNFEPAFKYLQEASRLNPNDVILAGHVNTVAIRLDEMSRQSEAHDTRAVGKTILVVDDSPTVRKLISGKLEKSGHKVVCAVDGVDALAKLEEGMPDLVLLDIAMPRMDGYEVCKQIRANPASRDLPVVMISGKDGFFDKVRGNMAGTTGYVTKPFGPETLMKALETYLLPEEVEVG